jgi:hypothetical protein
MSLRAVGEELRRSYVSDGHELHYALSWYSSVNYVALRRIFGTAFEGDMFEPAEQWNNSWVGGSETKYGVLYQLVNVAALLRPMVRLHSYALGDVHRAI